MNFRTFLTATALSTLIVGAASAQMWEGYDRSLGYDGFSSGMSEQGNFAGWDSNADGMIGEDEFATGVYADWDRDNDQRITEEEYITGAGRWYGTDYIGDFASFDADGSGYIDQSEYGSNWDSTYYTGWDGDGDGMLSGDEYNRGLYDRADLDGDSMMSADEEVWFDGWFEGADVGAEINEIGETYTY